MEMVGHRGSSWAAAENTLESIKLAWEHGAEGVEFDIHLSADGELFLLHDYTLWKRASRDCPAALCSDGKLTEAEYLDMLNVTVGTLSYADFIRHVDIGSWKGDPAYAGITVPLLKDAMDSIPAGKYALVEIKGGRGDNVQELVVASVAAAVEHGWGADKMHWISFNFTACAVAKYLFKEAGMKNLVWYVRRPLSEAETLSDIKFAVEYELDGVDWVADPDVVTAKAVDEAHKQGLQVAVWVSPARFPESDTPESANLYKEYGTDIFTTDFTPDMQEWTRNQK